MLRLITIPVSCCLFLLNFVAARTASGNDTSVQHTHPCSYLTVRSETEQFRVYIDSSYSGLTPIDSVCTAAGKHLLRYLPVDTTRWSSVLLTDTVDCPPEKLTEKKIVFPRHFFLSSEPYGATVSGEGKIIGVTPLWLPVYNPQNSFTISKDGYRNSIIAITTDTIFTLQPLNAGISPMMTDHLSPATPGSTLPVYLTAAAALLSGASAAYFKIKADNLNSDYGMTGNTADISGIHHNDTIAGISLAVCQINLLGLAYLLFSR